MAGLFESPVKTIKDLPDLKYYPIFDKRSWMTPTECETPPKRARMSEKSHSTTPKSRQRTCSLPLRKRKHNSNEMANKSFINSTYILGSSTPKAKESFVSKSSPNTSFEDTSSSSSPNSGHGRRSSNSRKAHYNHREQYTLDFGQRSSESKHQCSVCKMFYIPNEIDDEKQHRKFHDITVKGICYNSPWKNEIVLKEFEDGKVILIQAGSNQSKLKQLFDHVTEELGLCIDLNTLREHSLLLLFISYQNSRRIVGLLTGEKIEKAFRLLNDDPLRCSTETVPAQFGISIIWVHQAYRRQRICWRLFQVFCDNVGAKDKSKVALSQPSLAVINFARKFLQTEQLLVYEMDYFKCLE